MGMPVSVLARGAMAHSNQADSAVRAVYAELTRVDAMFSPYRPDSEVSLLARGEVSLSDCAGQVRDVAARCVRARDLTGGLFDATRPTGDGILPGW